MGFFLAPDARKALLLTAFLISLLVAREVSLAPAEDPPQPVTVRFGDLLLGAPPASFTPALTGGGGAVRWEVVVDPSAPSGRAVAELSQDHTNYRFPLLIHEMTATNVGVSVRFRAVSGTVDQAAGIAARLSDPETYYVVWSNALEDNVNLYHVVHGRRSQIANTSTPVASGQWHVLGLRIDGDRMTASFDGREVLTATDRTFLGPEGVALWTKADSVTHFDELIIRPL